MAPLRSGDTAGWDGHAASVLDARTKRYLDTILAAWCAIWILLGVAVYHELRGLRSLADSVAVAGDSLENTADTLD